MSKQETNYNPARTTEAHHTQAMSIDEVNAQDKANRKPEKPIQTQQKQQQKSKRSRGESEGKESKVDDDEDEASRDAADASDKHKEKDPKKKSASPEAEQQDQHADKKAKTSTAAADDDETEADELTNTKEDLAKTGAGEPATQAQKGFVQTLAKQAGEDVPQDLDGFDRAQASSTIDRLKPHADREQPSALEADTTPQPGSHLAKPQQWATGEDPATEKQGRYLAVLERKAGEEPVGAKNMSKGEASQKINDLKQQTQA